jgi:tetratricopeptide (TPR) repeat protein
VYYHAGDYVQATEVYLKSLELDSNYVYTYAYLGQTYAIQNKLDEAEKAFQYAVQLTKNKDPATLAGLAYVYARQKRTEMAMSIVRQLENFSNDLYVHPVYLAIIYQALGDNTQVFFWLDKGYRDRSEWMIFLQVEHMLDPLRSDDRFMKLLEKMNF